MVGRPPMRMKNCIVSAVVCVSMLVPASSAFAASASSDAYSKPSGSIQEQISTQHDPTETSTTTASNENKSGNLPFTGLDVALIIAAGGVLLAMGVGIRRLSRTTEVA